ncbi:hypothetical protein OCU04_012586 [Sclerotinia nivalis]|uniref:Chitinase n=1 Tax=Sclerotinia nivalis TaxID=352851 RepID=A0A9X0DCI8_9HELO|nr:hypothetical protein OCU04_012586 [Sclerotinia nivalis]
MIQRLRAHFIGAEKQYLITGAPQCIIPDANMGNMIAASQFDILFIQFYNTPQCSVHSWTNANPNYLTTGIEEFTSFSYNTWANFLVGTASANAKLYIGVLGAPVPDSDYLTRSEMSSMVKAYICRENFGGIMMWEATSAAKNIGPDGRTYYQAAKEILVHYENEAGLCCNTSVVPDKTLQPTCIPTGKTDTNVRPSPLPIQSGMSTQCASFHLVKNGDNCYNIAKAVGVSLKDFFAWNPAVKGGECSGLWPGYHVCIRVF